MIDREDLIERVRQLQELLLAVCVALLALASCGPRPAPPREPEPERSDPFPPGLDHVVHVYRDMVVVVVRRVGQ